MIARALAQEPALIVLDEPTNHLDIRHQIELMQRLRGLATSVLTTVHDLNVAGFYCDRLYLIDAGRVVARGQPSEVLTAASLAAAFGIAALIDRHPHAADRPRVTPVF